MSFYWLVCELDETNPHKDIYYCQFYGTELRGEISYPKRGSYDRMVNQAIMWKKEFETKLQREVKIAMVFRINRRGEVAERYQGSTVVCLIKETFMGDNFYSAFDGIVELIIPVNNPDSMEMKNYFQSSFSGLNLKFPQNVAYHEDGTGREIAKIIDDPEQNEVRLEIPTRMIYLRFRARNQDKSFQDALSWLDDYERQVGVQFDRQKYKL